MITKEQIEKQLSEQLNIIEITVDDQTRFHQKHPEAKRHGGGHFSVSIISSDFVGQSLMARHRRVYQILDAFIPEHIHALTIKAFTPDESQLK